MLGITFPATVTRVLDGDTIEVQINRTIRIRLLDCWAPETRTRDLAEKRRGHAAKSALWDLLQGDDLLAEVEVSVPIEAGGKFGDAMSMGRVLGRVRMGDVDISEFMVAAGHATKDKDGPASHPPVLSRRPADRRPPVVFTFARRNMRVSIQDRSDIKDHATPDALRCFTNVVAKGWTLAKAGMESEMNLSARETRVLVTDIMGHLHATETRIDPPNAATFTFRIAKWPLYWLRYYHQEILTAFEIDDV